MTTRYLSSLLTWDLLQKVGAKVLEDILGWNVRHLDPPVKSWHLMNLVLVRGRVDEALVNRRLYESRLDLFTRPSTGLKAEELLQLRVNKELVFSCSVPCTTALLLLGCVRLLLLHLCILLR